MRRTLAALLSVAALVTALFASTPVGAGPPPPPYVVAAGDIACAKTVIRSAVRCHEDATAALFALGGPLAGAQAILPLGDLQYPAGKYVDFIYAKPGCVVGVDGGTDPCSFDGSFGAAQATTSAAWRPTPGNHEYKDPTTPDAFCPRLRGTTSGGAPYSACGYERYFGSGTAAPTSDGDGLGNYWYTIDPGAAHPILFISLNVGQCEKNGTPCTSSGTVATFLKTTLANDTVNPPGACVVAYWHQPRWSRFGHKNFGKAGGVWAGLFSVTGADLPDLVINGHSHNYQRYAPLSKVGEAGTANPSIPEIIVGTGGNDHDAEALANANPNRPPAPLAFDPDSFGALKVSWDSVNGSISTGFFEEGTSAPADTTTYTCH